MTTIEDLPEEVHVSILSHLRPSDLALGVGLASRSYHRIAGDDSLWWRHLDICHPKWRIVMSNLKVDAAATPPRECLRRLTERHDPTEDRAGCCQHDLNRGALCLCCTCRRYHHNIDQSNARSACKWSLNGYFVAQAYGSGSATKETLARRTGHPISEWDSVLTWHGGILTTSAKTGRVEWTPWAHRSLRPPLKSRWQYGECVGVLYTDAELYAMNHDSHPELLEASLEEHRDMLQSLLGYGKRRIKLDDKCMRLASCGWRTPEQTRADIGALSDAGWIVLCWGGMLGNEECIHLTEATLVALGVNDL